MPAFATLFENEHFLAVDKSAGVLTIPGRQGAHDQRPCLVTELSARGVRVWPVHRLDFEVSGLVLFARSEAAHRAANAWFEGRQIRKTYEAWSEGQPQSDWRQGQSLEWACQLLRGKKRAYENPHGKPCRTQATWKGFVDVAGVQAMRWTLEPLTGRSHQLRYELFRHGCPIIGDLLYGAKAKFGESAIALRAVRLSFRDCPQAREFGLPEVLTAPPLGERT